MPRSDKDHFANWVVELRRRMNMTQVDFAREARVNPQTVSRWENGAHAPYGAVLYNLVEIGTKYNMPDPPEKPIEIRDAE